MSSCALPATVPGDPVPAEPSQPHAGGLQPTAFANAYPAPWRIQPGEVVDADGCNIQDIDTDDRDELAFWRGVVLAINIRESLVDELRHVRLYVNALAKRKPDIDELQVDLARLDLVIQQSGAR